MTNYIISCNVKEKQYKPNKKKEMETKEIKLSPEELKFYLHKKVEIKNAKVRFLYHGRINSLRVENDILKIGLAGMKKYEYESSKWVKDPEFTEHSVNLVNCKIPDWEEIPGKALCLYCITTGDEIALQFFTIKE